MDARHSLSPSPEEESVVRTETLLLAASAGADGVATADTTDAPPRCPICAARLPPPAHPGEPPTCLSCLLLAGIDAPTSPEAGKAGRPGRLTEGGGRRLIGERFGNFEVLEELGRGGMGVIYRARQIDGDASGRIVALKTIRYMQSAADDGDNLERFRREAEAAASLDHPNILPIYEVGEVDGQPFFSMQLADGGSLAAARLKFAGQPREAVALVLKIVRAIAHAHGRGVLHRDLKPANILLDAAGEPLVADFGLAKWLDRQSDLTQSLIIFGTPGYLAPEQAAGHANHATPAADIYSLGAILYELLCGRPPFIGANAWDVLQQAAHHPAAPLRKRNPQASRDLETICARCLETEPLARYQTATALAEDLDRWLARRSIQARPVSPPAKVWRWARRNPVVAVVSCACLLFVALSAVSYWKNTRLGAAVREQVLARSAVAVLPLENLDNIEKSAAPIAAFDQALLARLRQEKNRRVTAATLPAGGDAGCPQDWQRVGRAANSRAVLSGSLRHREGGLRVVLRLAAVSDGRVIERRVLDVQSKDIAAITEAAAALAQEAGSVAEKAHEEGEFAAASSKVEARDYLRMGKDHLLRLTTEDLQRSIGLFERAVAVDADCATAHALLASAFAAKGWVEPGRDWPKRARQEAEAALRLDPRLAEAHRALGVVLMQEKRVRAALEEAITAYELDPTESRNATLLGSQSQALGQPCEALRWYAKAERRRPRPGAFAGQIGDALADLAEDDRAAEAYQKFSEFRPGNPDSYLCVARLHMFHNDFHRARLGCQSALELAPNVLHVRTMQATVELFARNFAVAEKLYRDLVNVNREGGETFTGGVGYLCALGWLRRHAGDEAEGRALLLEARQQALTHLREAPEMPWQLYSLAAVCAALDEKEAALVIFDQAVNAGWVDYRSTQLDPRFDSIAGEPRFQRTLSRLSAHIAELRRQWLAASAAELLQPPTQQ